MTRVMGSTGWQPTAGWLVAGSRRWYIYKLFLAAEDSPYHGRPGHPDEDPLERIL